MDANKLRQALAFTNTFRKIGYPYVHTAIPRQSQTDALYMAAVQLSAALAQLLGREEE